jgi:hypothetical protein
MSTPDFSSQEEAQAYFDLHPGDPEGLDGPRWPTSSGVPGLACEDRPRQGSTTTVATIPSTQDPTATTLLGERTSSPNSGAASNPTAEPGSSTQLLTGANRTATT